MTAKITRKEFSASVENDHLQLPERYKFLSVLGEGGFGQVLKCEDTQTKREVAVKILKSVWSRNEESVLKTLMSNNLGKYHIVEYYDSFITQHRKAMVFELLDISLEDYILENQLNPVPLNDIRAVVKQIATALGALKDIKLIHCDIKPDNIMLINRRRHPLQVKLIDFGLSLPTEKVKIGMAAQTAPFRSPEVILGLPFSEAIDMWSLGCLMAVMMLRGVMFPAINNYEAMQFIVERLGLPAVHLLESGKYTERHFIKTESGEWQFKDPQVYGHYNPPPYSRKFQLLDELRKVRQKVEDKTQDEEWGQCIDLLMAMVEMDPRKRITPSEVLNHPFINPVACNQYYLQKRKKEKQAGIVSESISDSSDCEPSVSALKDDGVTNIQSDSSSPLPSAASPRVIQVKPATPEHTMLLDQQERDISLQKRKKEKQAGIVSESISDSSDCEPSVSALKDDGVTNIQSDSSSPLPSAASPRVIQVKPATPEHTMLLDQQERDISLQKQKKEKQAGLVSESISDSSDFEPSVSALKDDGVTNIQSDSSSPLPSAASPRVIQVKPATPEHTMLLDQQESDISLQVHKNLTPASPDEESEKKNSDQEPPATALSEEVTHNQTDHHSPSLTDQAGLNKVSESTVEVTEIQEKALTSKDANPGEAKQAKKKRKTICQRIVCWVRRYICPKRVSPLVDEGRENF